ncbi:MAG: aerobic respiration two-component sensor histidine kinase ArcB [Atlantibacter hermannii]|uniref:aerobic respiration two-component sensor histidine kinase ArcB n=1 Tax=Atlantibacter hermannii TaxID=565 RepID=UPI0028FF0C48|nr:aerobic respiration two-component sensor histidine kinase ArcB [Atlantibacter hermannii]MDU1953423.1 aerobic respiration two-component sensor histidine kinase ArcB [Atlantibacter hermannii]
MKQIRMLAQYYVDLLVKLGLVRFSLLLALALVILAMVVQMAVTMVLHGRVESIDVIRSIFFGLLITPWAVYFLSVVVEQLEESRQRLSKLVDKLEEMRERDLKLTVQLKDNINQLNQQNAEREKAEAGRQRVLEQLTVEMKEREVTQIQLEQQSSFLRSFLDASPDLVFYRNEDKAFSGCNRAMELLTGKSEKQLIGLQPHDVYAPEAAEKVIETDEKVFRHNVSLTYEQWLDYPDGRKACFEIRKVPYYDRVGKRHGLMGFGRDITERKRYQDALERASRDKTTFISTISHELRTPLNGIVGLSRILLDTDLTPEQHKYLQTIHVSAVTLGHIFNDIIDMDKIERRKVQLDNQPIDFTGFLADLENLSGLQAQQKGLRFVMEPALPLPLPHKVITDGTRLRQIIWNLISNAVKFTQKGQVTVRVSYENGMLRFEVEDSGIGIPQSEQDKIFAMYYQVKDSHGGKPATGTGIGLAVSRRLAKNMGGDITVSSHPGKGSVFTLTVQAPRVAEEIDSTTSDDDMPLPALHVLLVEDIELNVIVARSVLEKMGNSVDVAMTGQEALDMFKLGEYDLVLLDIQLPDMTGLDISRKLTSQFQKEELPPLVALTANVLKDKGEYLAAGMDDVLSKPLSVPALTAMIKKFWDTRTNQEERIVSLEQHSKQNALLDVAMLEQYIELVGPKLITDGLAVFEKMMPGYLSILDSNLTARDQKGIVEEGHKIKGAAGSIGLRHLQQVAQQIQSPDLPAWWDNVGEWIEELKQEWQNDVAVLKAWVANAPKK